MKSCNGLPLHRRFSACFVLVEGPCNQDPPSPISEEAHVGARSNISGDLCGHCCRVRVLYLAPVKCQHVL